MRTPEQKKQHAAYMREYRRQFPECGRAARQKYVAENREAIAEKMRLYRLKNLEKLRKKDREWTKKNYKRKVWGNRVRKYKKKFGPLWEAALAAKELRLQILHDPQFLVLPEVRAAVIKNKKEIQKYYERKEAHQRKLKK